MRPIIQLTISLVILVGFAQSAWSHARLLDPTPRLLSGGQNPDGLKSGPCGGLAPDLENLPVYDRGEVITISWEETVDHSGHYELLISDQADPQDEMAFVFLKDDNGVELSEIADQQGGGLPHSYSATVQLPEIDCAACTIQMKQYMAGSDSYYFSCANVQIGDAGNGGMGGSLPDPDIESLLEKPDFASGCGMTHENSAGQSGPGSWAYIIILLPLLLLITNRPKDQKVRVKIKK